MIPRQGDDSDDREITREEREHTERRATIVAALREHGGTSSLFDLATTIAGRRRTGEAAEEEGLERIRCRLHHIDLPSLADEGVLEYDTERWTVSLPDEQREFPAVP